jgi:hypothetical protein
LEQLDRSDYFELLGKYPNLCHNTIIHEAPKSKRALEAIKKLEVENREKLEREMYAKTPPPRRGSLGSRKNSEGAADQTSNTSTKTGSAKFIADGTAIGVFSNRLAKSRQNGTDKSFGDIDAQTSNTTKTRKKSGKFIADGTAIGVFSNRLAKAHQNTGQNAQQNWKAAISKVRVVKQFGNNSKTGRRKSNFDNSFMDNLQAVQQPMKLVTEDSEESEQKSEEKDDEFNIIPKRINARKSLRSTAFSSLLAKRSADGSTGQSGVNVSKRSLMKQRSAKYLGITQLDSKRKSEDVIQSDHFFAQVNIDFTGFVHQ